MDSSPATPSVLVIGSGISGLACARALHDGGATVRVVDRGRVVGGRLATKRLDDRPVDIGARYFTVPDDSPFAAVVTGWTERGLVRPWTDTFDVMTADGSRQGKSGPMRYAGPGGLRSLATDLAERLRAEGVPVDQQVDITGVAESGVVAVGGSAGGGSAGDAPADSGLAGGVLAGIRYDFVVLAMPDPQAARMLEPSSPAAAELTGAADWQPTISVVAAWPERHWPADLHGAFVDSSEVLAFVADDGDRRGDGAAVLVAHTTPDFARQHLEHPEAAVAPVVDALRTLLGIALPPISTYAHRWTFSNPAAQHDAPYLLSDRVAVCGDAWGERSAVSTAWASGDALGRALTA